MPRTSSPRLRDVAAAAGVSQSTASRALTGSGASEQAVAAVLAASKRLGYRPDPVARAMRTRFTRLVGMIVPGISNPFFAELVEATENALRAHNLDLILADSRGSPEEEHDRLETMVDRKVDGLIVIPAHHISSADSIRRAAKHVDLVQVDRQVDGLATDYVGVDNAAGIRVVLEHVNAQGCRDVVFVSDGGSSSTGHDRLRAFDVGVGHVAGLSPRPPLLGEFTIDFGREAACKLLNQRKLPDAIICGADFIALGLVRELRAHKVSIPRQVKVTGFDGILFSGFCDPPLTTLRQPVSTIAREAARLLAARLQGDRSPPHRNQIAPALVVRRSSSGAASSR